MSLPSDRPSIDDTFMDIVRIWAKRSTCPRLNVGAVLARDSRIISTGYNGAPPGLPHCTHALDERCETAVHAEANVLAFAAKHGVSTRETTLYTTHSPCRACSGLLISAGIVRVVFAEHYLTEGTDWLSGIRRLEDAGITVEEERM